MNRTAYVICWFSIVGGVPRFKGAGIYSEDSESITVDGSVVPMDVFSVDGKNFEDAINGAMEMIRLNKHRLGWLLPHLEMRK